jgi:hypothetical protein
MKIPLNFLYISKKNKDDCDLIVNQLAKAPKPERQRLKDWVLTGRPLLCGVEEAMDELLYDGRPCIELVMCGMVPGQRVSWDGAHYGDYEGPDYITNAVNDLRSKYFPLSKEFPPKPPHSIRCSSTYDLAVGRVGHAALRAAILGMK